MLVKITQEFEYTTKLFKVLWFLSYGHILNTSCASSLFIQQILHVMSGLFISNTGTVVAP